jgi:hypothetical protein
MRVLRRRSLPGEDLEEAQPAARRANGSGRAHLGPIQRALAGSIAAIISCT